MSNLEILTDKKKCQTRAKEDTHKKLGIVLKPSVTTVKNKQMNCESKPLVPSGTKYENAKDSIRKILPSTSNLNLFAAYTVSRETSSAQPKHSERKSSSEVLKKVHRIPKQELNKTTLNHFSKIPKRQCVKTFTHREFSTLNKRGYSSDGCQFSDVSNRANKHIIEGISRNSTSVRPKRICPTPRGCRFGTKPKVIPHNPKILKYELNATKGIEKGGKSSRRDTKCQPSKVLRWVSSSRGGELFSNKPSCVIWKSRIVPPNPRGLGSKTKDNTILNIKNSHDESVESVTKTLAMSPLLQRELQTSSEAICELLRADYLVQENESLLQDQTGNGVLVDLTLATTSPNKLSLREDNKDDSNYQSMLNDTKYLTMIDESGSNFQSFQES